MEFMIQNMIRTDKIVEPWVFEGATIEGLTHEAEYYAQKAPFDFLFIVGGICNITTKNKVMKKTSFEWENTVELASYLVRTMEEAEKYLYKKHPASTFIFCPLTGADLSKCLKRPADKEQEILNEAIWIYNEEVFNANVLKNVYAPNFAESVHRQINGINKTFLNHPDKDGIHLTKSLEEKWAKKVIKLADRYERTFRNGVIFQLILT